MSFFANFKFFFIILVHALRANADETGQPFFYKCAFIKLCNHQRPGRTSCLNRCTAINSQASPNSLKEPVCDKTQRQFFQDMFDRLAPEKYGAVDEELQSLQKSADM
jgi:hypothetical protein